MTEQLRGAALWDEAQVADALERAYRALRTAVAREEALEGWRLYEVEAFVDDLGRALRCCLHLVRADAGGLTELAARRRARM